MMNLIKQGERLDDLDRNGYKIIQNPDKFRFGMDAVVLAGFAKVQIDERVLDLGTGTGIIPILLRGRTGSGHYTGLEIQPEIVDMARRSVAFNHLEEDIDIVEGDIKEARSIFNGNKFNVVTSNPPYMEKEGGLINESLDIAAARHEILCTLEDVIREGAKVLEPLGRFYMVHRPYRLPEIISVFMRYGLEPKRMQLVHPFVDKEPNMVLLECIKGGRPRMKVEPPLIVHMHGGGYTIEMQRDYGF